jgi:hypothetical protein
MGPLFFDLLGVSGVPGTKDPIEEARSTSSSPGTHT